jgi:hypothetical protein
MWLIENKAVTLEDVRDVTCPECLAQPGQSCLGALRQNGTRRARSTNHIDRWHAYVTNARDAGLKVKILAKG